MADPNPQLFELFSPIYLERCPPAARTTAAGRVVASVSSFWIRETSCWRPSILRTTRCSQGATSNFLPGKASGTRVAMASMCTRAAMRLLYFFLTPTAKVSFTGIGHESKYRKRLVPDLCDPLHTLRVLILLVSFFSVVTVGCAFFYHNLGWV